MGSDYIGEGCSKSPCPYVASNSLVLVNHTSYVFQNLILILKGVPAGAFVLSMIFAQVSVLTDRE